MSQDNIKTAINIMGTVTADITDGITKIDGLGVDTSGLVPAANALADVSAALKAKIAAESSAAAPPVVTPPIV